MTSPRAQTDPAEAWDAKDPRAVQVAKMWVSRRRALAREAANLMGGAASAEDVNAAEERKMWHQRDPAVDPYALYAQGASREEVAAAEFPNRHKMMTSGGRKDDPHAQYEFVQRMTRLGPPQIDAPAPMPAAPQPTDDTDIMGDDSQEGEGYY